MNDIVEKGVDLSRMTDIIHKSILECYNRIEEQSHRTIQFLVIGHYLYGENEQQLEYAFNEIKRLESLQSKDIGFWNSIIKEYDIS